MYVCMYVYIHIYIYVYTHTHKHTHTHTLTWGRTRAATTCTGWFLSSLRARPPSAASPPLSICSSPATCYCLFNHLCEHMLLRTCS